MAVKTQGTDLYFIDPEDDSVVTVGCVTSISGVDASRDQIEVTCLKDAARIFEAGLGTPGSATFGINFDPTDASNVRMHELYVEGTKIDWALGWSDGEAAPTVDEITNTWDAPATRTFLLFNGYIDNLPFDFSLNAVVESNVSVQVSGFPELSAKE